jgi:hypothetical protein
LKRLIDVVIPSSSRLVLQGMVPLLVLLIGCRDGDSGERYVEESPTLLQRYDKNPETPAEVTVFWYPPVPVVKSPEGLEAKNLLSNPGFENGQVRWTLTGSQTAEYAATDLLQVEGDVSLQVIPGKAATTFLSPTLALRPRSFYSFSAFLYSPGESDAALEVRDADGIALLSTEALSGPMSVWSWSSLRFITGMRTEGIRFGIRCSGNVNNDPFYIDQCALYALPSIELLQDGTMENVPEDGRMAVWYMNGKSASRTPESFHGTYGLELPPLAGRNSWLACLISPRQQLEARAVWVSAMVKSVSELNAQSPEVTLILRLKDAEGKRSTVSASYPTTGEWEEVTMLATMPEQITGDPADEPPPQILVFQLPTGAKGRVLVDEVTMLGVPEGRFDGGAIARRP